MGKKNREFIRASSSFLTILRPPRPIIFLSHIHILFKQPPGTQSCCRKMRKKQADKNAPILQFACFCQSISYINWTIKHSLSAFSNKWLTLFPRAVFPPPTNQVALDIKQIHWKQQFLSNKVHLFFLLHPFHSISIPGKTYFRIIFQGFVQ